MKSVAELITEAAISDPDLFGETLRHSCFSENDGCGRKLYGCYSTFNLIPEFEEVELASELGKKLLNALMDDYGMYWEEGVEEKEIILDFLQDYPNINLWSNGNVHLAWYWEGDGTLLVVSEEEKKAALNDDCKHDYGWKWIFWE